MSQTAVDGVRLAVRVLDSGHPPAGAPVLLLHDAGDDGSSWGAVAPSLAADRPVLVPDLPGRGGSEAVVPASLEAAAGLLGALVLQQLDTEVDVVGHGSGGVLALALARFRPELVRRVAVLSAPYPVRRSLKKLLSGGPRHGQEAVTRLLAEQLRPAAHPTTRAWRSLVRTPLDDPEGGTELDVERALVVWGAADRVVPLRVGEDVVRALGPRCTLVTLPGVGHAPHREAPGLVADVLGSFVRAGDVRGVLPPAVGLPG